MFDNIGGSRLANTSIRDAEAQSYRGSFVHNSIPSRSCPSESLYLLLPWWGTVLCCHGAALLPPPSKPLFTWLKHSILKSSGEISRLVGWLIWQSSQLCYSSRSNCFSVHRGCFFFCSVSCASDLLWFHYMSPRNCSHHIFSRQVLQQIAFRR